MDSTDLTCQDRRGRRAQLRAAGFNGVDFVEIDEEPAALDPNAPPVLCVHFFGGIPDGLTAANVRIEGGRRIRDIKVTSVEKRKSSDVDLDDCLRVTLDRVGDLTTYRFCLVDGGGDGGGGADDDCDDGDRHGHGHGEGPGHGPGDRGKPLARIDPRYRCADFVFKVDCTGCATTPPCPAPDPGPTPEINYLAKDYGSFRQLLLDRLAVLVPDWKERHAADIGITLLELLAYVGDSLSYFQDAVATEAYLETARQRISVRRHARLVDYAMHEGCNARTFLALTSDADVPLKVGDVFFATGLGGSGCSGEGGVRSLEELAKAAPGAFEIFEPMVAPGQTTIDVVAAHSEIQIYTWGDSECCLPQGATRATLVDRTDAAGKGRALEKLAAGGLLLFEEVIGPETGDAADADPLHRHVVRLTKVVADVDPVFAQPIVEVEWDPLDALPFSLCLSVNGGPPDCETRSRLSVARSNVIVVDHGATVAPDEPLGEVGVESTQGICQCDGESVEITESPTRFRPVLARRPVTFYQPSSPPLSSAVATAAARLLIQDPHQALPAVTLASAAGGGDGAGGAGGAALTWTPRAHLLDSGPDDAGFVVEVDNDGRAHLRFGDGDLGRQPEARATFTARYRVGNGPDGNVGRDTITEVVLRASTLTGVLLRARNPLPAAGGAASEPIDEVKQLAPGAFRRILRRAITAADYAALAQAPGGVPSAVIQGAAAELQWTGSWYEAHVAVDPLGSETASAALLADVETELAPFRRVRHDLRVAPARYVPLDIALDVCVLPHHIQRDVVAALLEVLGNQRLRDGRLGFFHPDNLRFGQGVLLSRLVAAAQAVPGVQNVNVKTFKRLFSPETGEKENGVLPIRFSELAELDNDPNEIENGRLVIHAGGGR
jgi:hypothetical protein